MKTKDVQKRTECNEKLTKPMLDQTETMLRALDAHPRSSDTM